VAAVYAMGFISLGRQLSLVKDIESMTVACVSRMLLRAWISRSSVSVFGGVIGSVWLDRPCASRAEIIMLKDGLGVLVSVSEFLGE